MDWRALHSHPLWQELWETEEVKSRRAALVNGLLRGKETDPHTIGKLRGQLTGLDQIRALVENMAKAESAADVQEAAKAATGWRRLVPRA